MNSKKTIKNSIISVVAQVLSMILQFVNRRIFVMFLDIEYLGYQSVFGNVFSFLSVAELGIGEIISFHLFREIVTDNKQEIGKLMYLYKWIYRIIAAVVAMLGLMACIFVPYIVKDASKSIGYLYVVYFLQLASTVAGYFLSYRRTIYAVDQKEYKTIEIELFTKIIVQTLQLTLLAVFRNYLIYLVLQLGTTIIANLIILCKTNKEYPYLREKYTVSWEDIKSRRMISDVGNYLVHSISSAIYCGSDNIIISSICGIRTVALYGNYQILHSSVLNVLYYRLLNPVRAAIGNIIYSDRSKDELWRQFEMLDVFSSFFASYIGLGFLIFLQPAVQLWMGSTDYLLSDSFVILYSLTSYINASGEIVYKYRSVFGDYRQDRNCMLLSAVMNVVISVVLAHKLGVTGVQIGTLLAFLPITYGRVRFVVENYFDKPLKRYVIKHMLLFGIVLVESLFVYWLTVGIPINAVGILMRVLIWAAIPMAVNVLIYFQNPHFKDLCNYFKILFKIVIKTVQRHIVKTSEV